MPEAKTGRGRPPSWLLDPNSPGAVQQDVVEVESRNRILIPNRLVAGAPWLSPAGDGLMVFREPGRIVLYSWDPQGEAVIMRRRELIGEGDDADAVRELQLLEDTYRRYHLDAEARLTLHPPTIAHLDHRTVFKFLLLLRFEDRLELWSFDRRNEFLREGSELLSGLP